LKYEKREKAAQEREPAEGLEEKATRFSGSATSWKEIKREELESKPDRYKRGLRDIFKPWEY
jgi:hypothetical protein